ncbi:LysM peptidoglycan-binding domain-containing protein, partial [Cumulibacter manganitolerans]|uniref:LysM peptidoglycan-binding domain-containing protein n=1 Tax=Cumulibacter manganitolerans TaxID=1884992 RepID=UPI001885CEB2
PVAEAAPRSLATGRRPRLTRRGYTALLGVVVGSIAGTSALTLAQADTGPSVAATQVVVRSGETLEQVASRAAFGRDVTEVAAAIRIANDLPAQAPLQAGEVVVVPGS